MNLYEQLVEKKKKELSKYPENVLEYHEIIKSLSYVSPKDALNLLDNINVEKLDKKITFYYKKTT